MKKWCSIILCVAIILMLAGCSTPTEKQINTSETPYLINDNTPEPTQKAIVEQTGTLGELTFTYSSITEPTITEESYLFTPAKGISVTIGMFPEGSTNYFDDEEANEAARKMLQLTLIDSAIDVFESGSVLSEGDVAIPGANGSGYYMDYVGILKNNGLSAAMNTIVFHTETALYAITMLSEPDDESSPEVYRNLLSTIQIAGQPIMEESEESDSETVEATESSETVSQSNAVRQAKSYLKFMAFSRQGLIEQLEYEGFSNEDATYGVDNCGADWMEQAVECAKSYLDTMAFSREGLIEQLEYEGFTHEQAVYGVDATGL